MASPKRLPCPVRGCKSTMLNEQTVLMHLKARHPDEWERSRGTGRPMAERVARCYVRVSTSDQSVEVQKAKIAAYLSLKGISPLNIRWYEDPGVSGTVLERPGIMALLADTGPGDLFVLTHPDRLSRKIQDFATLTQAIRSKGADIYCTEFPADTTEPSGLGEMVWKWFGLLAEFAWYGIASRSIDGIESARAKGVKLGRHRNGCGITHPCPTGRHGNPNAKKPTQVGLGISQEKAAAVEGVE